MTLLSSNIEVSDTMNAQEYLNYELEFDLNNPYEPIDEEFLGMFPFEHQEPDVDEVIVGVVEEVVGLNVAKRSLENLKKYFHYTLMHRKYFFNRPFDVLPHIKSIEGLQKEVSSHRLVSSHQTTIDSFFHLAWLKESHLLLYKLF